MKNGLWTKIVIVIITLEILVGAIYYGYKKIVTTIQVVYLLRIKLFTISI